MGFKCKTTKEMVPIKSERGHSLFFSSSLALLSFHFLVDERTISGVYLLEMAL